MDTCRDSAGSDNHNSVLRLIQIIRESFPESVEVYTEGSCFQFYRILKEIYPQAEPWYDSEHVITKIEGRFYDVTGEVEKGSHYLLTTEPRIYNEAFNWRYA